MIDIDAEIAAAEKRLRERTNRRAGQVLRRIKERIALDHYEDWRRTTLALREWPARRDVDVMVAGKITDPIE